MDDTLDVSSEWAAISLKHHNTVLLTHLDNNLLQEYITHHNTQWVHIGCEGTYLPWQLPNLMSVLQMQAL